MVTAPKAVPPYPTPRPRLSSVGGVSLPKRRLAEPRCYAFCGPWPSIPTPAHLRNAENRVGRALAAWSVAGHYPQMDDLDLGPSVDFGTADLDGVIRRLMEVAKVAVGEGMEPPLTDEETINVLAALLAVVERRMPDDLQAQDRRVLDARAWLHVLRQLNGER